MANPMDTIVVPATPAGFREVFVGKRIWPGVRLSDQMRSDLKYVAVYQTKPVSAITHYARICNIRPSEKVGRYDIILDANLIELESIPFTTRDLAAVQSPRYTNLSIMLKATCLSDAF